MTSIIGPIISLLCCKFYIAICKIDTKVDLSNCTGDQISFVDQYTIHALYAYLLRFQIIFSLIYLYNIHWLAIYQSYTDSKTVVHSSIRGYCSTESVM